MNLRFLIALTSSLFVSASVLGQANALNASNPEDIGVKTEAQVINDNDQPLEYGYVDDRDVLWAKTTWEIIDLDESCLLYTSPSPRDKRQSRMPSSA